MAYEFYIGNDMAIRFQTTSVMGLTDLGFREK